MHKNTSPMRTITVTTLVASLLATLLTPTPFPVKAQQAPRQLKHDKANTQTEKRLALVIGNGNYINAPALKNPVNDAADMAKALSDVGFTVEHGVDLNQKQMKFMIREFGRNLKGGGQGLFYFAGHGVQLRGRNYLIPVDADIQSETEVEDQCVDANLMLGFMEEAGNNLNVVILDACRNNPFARNFRSASNGLAQIDAPSGTLIAYATAPGSVASDGNGRNGLYTQELLRFMRNPGLEIEDVFKQVRISVRNLTQNKQTPWESSSLIGNFYFVVDNGITTPSNAQPSPVKSSNASQPELRLADMISSYAYEIIDLSDKGRIWNISFDGCNATWKKSIAEITIPLKDIRGIFLHDNASDQHPFTVSIHTEGLVVRELKGSKVEYDNISLLHFDRKDIAAQVQQDLLNLSQRCK